MTEVWIQRSGDPECSAAIMDAARVWHDGTPLTFSPAPAAVARAVARFKQTIQEDRDRNAKFSRIRLVGDEDGGVGIECLDCWGGGRPLGYLGDGYATDSAVTVVTTVPELLDVGLRHREEKHP
jgi:hypothetical protein